MKHLIALNDTGQCYCLYGKKKEDSDEYQYGWQQQSSVYQVEYSTDDTMTELVFGDDVPDNNIYDILILFTKNDYPVRDYGIQLLFSFNKIKSGEIKYYYDGIIGAKINNYILISLNNNNKLSLKIYHDNYDVTTGAFTAQLCNFRYRVINNFEKKQMYRPFFTIDEKYKCLGSGNFTADNKLQYCLHPSSPYSKIENGKVDIDGTTEFEFKAPILTSILYRFNINYIYKEQFISSATTFSLGLEKDRIRTGQSNNETLYRTFCKNIPVGDLNLDGNFEDSICIRYTYEDKKFKVYSKSGNIDRFSIEIDYLTI